MKLLAVGVSSQDIKVIKQIFSNGRHQLSLVDDEQAALELLKSIQFDLIVVSNDDKAINCNDLLAAASIQLPKAIRIALTSAQNNSELEFAHSKLDSPLNGRKFISLLESFISCNKGITKQTIVKAVSEIKTLPSPPKVYMQLNSLLKEDTTDSQKIAEIIAQDPALVAKVLHFANSSAMSKGKQLTSIPEAITKVGVDTLCCIVMTAELFAYEPNIEGFSLTNEQLHCLNTAKLAASLVKPEFKLDALLAGLLHDIGKLVLFEINPVLTKKYFARKTTTSDNLELEQAIFSTDHCQIGGYLLHLWSFPYPIIEAVVQHHSPKKLLKKSFGVAQAVFLANQLLNDYPVDEQFIEHFQLTNVMDKLTTRAKRLTGN